MKDNVLKKLMESEVLAPETKAEIKEHFDALVEQMENDAIVNANEQITEQVAAKLAESKEIMETEIKTELIAKFIQEREDLANTLVEQVQTHFELEMVELRESIAEHKDLEVDYQEKLLDNQKALAEQFSHEKDLMAGELVAYVTEKMIEERDELKESIEENNKNRFGRDIFDTFKESFVAHFVDIGSQSQTIQDEMNEMKSSLDQLTTAVFEKEQTINAMKHDAMLTKVLEPLTGKRRAVMEQLLQNKQPTEMQEEYDRRISKIMLLVNENESFIAPESNIIQFDDLVTTGDEITESVEFFTDDHTDSVTENQKPTISADDLRVLREISGIL